MKRALVVAVLAAAASLTACVAPQPFTPDGLRDEVSGALPDGWRVTDVRGEDAGGCLITCIAHADLTVHAPRGDLRPQLHNSLVRHGWTHQDVAARDYRTKARYPLAESYDKTFHNRDDRTGSYELIPKRISATEVRLYVEIDAHDL